MDLATFSTMTVIIFLVIYFFPTIVAMIRGHKNLLAVFVLNLFLGWSIIGWVVALVWACMAQGGPQETTKPLPPDTWGLN